MVENSMAKVASDVKSRVIVAAEDLQLQQRLVMSLEKLGIQCPPGHVVPLELAAGRASRAGAELVFLVLSENSSAVFRTIKETRTVVDARVVVVGPVLDPRLILDTLHAGVEEYLDQDRLEEDLPAALLRLRMKTAAERAAHETGRVIGVLGATGGSGASTIAVNVATGFARAHHECAMVDLRFTSADLAALLNLRPSHTLADFCENSERMDQEMFERFLAVHKSGIKLIAAPVDFRRAEGVTTSGVRQAIAMARSRFPYVVLDLDNRLDDVQLEALWQTDQLLLVLRLDYTSIRNAQRLLSHLEDLGVDVNGIRLIANRYRQPKELRVAHVEEALGRKIDQFVRDDPSRINRSVNTGRPVVLAFPRSPIARELTGLSAAVNGRSPT
jgi:pilus assembly protein CpaE